MRYRTNFGALAFSDTGNLDGPRRDVIALRVHAAAVDLSPRPQVREPVRLRGDRLGRILWQLRQWAVTAYGLEARDGTYAIARNRLWEREAGYDWVMHMADKNWVDLADFAEALRIARRIHADEQGQQQPRDGT